MKIGILTSGGDCPGINATIRGVCKTAINHYGMEVYGIHSGFRGLLDNDVEPLTEKSLSGLLNLGGTILGTSREKPFKKRLSAASEDKPALMLKNIHDLGLDCIVCIGGNGTQKTAAKLAQAGVNVVSVPKTIDNDVWGTDVSFGFDSAVTIATDAIDRLHSTASSHQRVMVIEVMGHKAGWIALYSGMAGGGDVILIPELFLAEGFEEVEALTPVDVLRRAGLPVKTVSVTGVLTVNGAHGVPVVADMVFEEVKEGDAEMIVLPGGLPGATNLDAHEGLGKLIMTFAEAGRPLSAICAAPLVYGKRGLLKGKKVTCYPGFEKYLEGAEYTAALIEKDGNFITGKGPGAAMAFSFAIAEKYVGAEKVTELKQGMMIAE